MKPTPEEIKAGILGDQSLEDLIKKYGIDALTEGIIDLEKRQMKTTLWTVLVKENQPSTPTRGSLQRWMGTKPTNCQVCGAKLGKVFYDALVPHLSQWGLIGHCCFQQYRCSLGIGRGQKYNTETLEKIDG